MEPSWPTNQTEEDVKTTNEGDKTDEETLASLAAAANENVDPKNTKGGVEEGDVDYRLV